MAYSTIDWSLDRGILTLSLSRPERLNAFTADMADELIDAFGRASDDDAVRVVIVTGAGRAFCAGMDLSGQGNPFGLDESQSPTLDDLKHCLNEPAVLRGVRDTGGRVALSIFDCKKPVIAAVNGAAVGVGATMTLPMDIRIASDQARFGFVFGKIGIVPEACSTWFLPRVVGLSQALEWMYNGDVFDAAEALRGGLIKAVVPTGQLLDAAHRVARRISENHSAVAIALTRQMMYRNSAAAHPLEAHRIESLAVFYTSLADGREGVRAFREKRAPVFESHCFDQMPSFFPWWE